MDSLPIPDNRTCDICGAPHKARGLCIRCYQRLWANGTLKTLPQEPLDKQFWDRVDKRGADECWPWAGYSRNAQGYGGLQIGGKKLRSTHISWYLHHGEWPHDLGLWVLHKCDNPACVNPAHLFLGTAADNNLDMVRKGRNRHPAGEAHYRARLTVPQVRAIRQLGAEGTLSQVEIAERFGVAVPTVNAILVGRSWKGVR